MAKKKSKTSGGLLGSFLSLVASVVVFVMMLISKVTVTNTTIISDNKNTLKGDPIGFFEFMDKAKEADTYSTARVFMLVGFILACVALAYFLLTFVLEVLGKGKQVKKLNTLTVVVSLALVVATVLPAFIFVDKLVIADTAVISNYSVASLFSATWVIAIVCSLVPLTCKLALKK